MYIARSLSRILKLPTDIHYTLLTIGRVIRRVIVILRTRRDILFMVLSLVVSALTIAANSLIAGFGDKLLHWPIWLIAAVLVPYLIIFATLIFTMVNLLKGIQNIDEKEDEANRLNTAKLDAIVKKLDISREDLQMEREEDSMPKSNPQPPLTKNRFEKLLKKAAKPVSEWQHVPKVKQTSESHPSDGCNETHTNQDKTEGKEG